MARSQYMLTFAVMLVVALITTHLAASVRRQAAMAFGRGQRSLALYEMARRLAGALTVRDVERITCEFLRDTFGR